MLCSHALHRQCLTQRHLRHLRHLSTLAVAPRRPSITCSVITQQVRRERRAFVKVLSALLEEQRGRPNKLVTPEHLQEHVKRKTTSKGVFDGIEATAAVNQTPTDVRPKRGRPKKVVDDVSGVEEVLKEGAQSGKKTQTTKDDAPTTPRKTRCQSIKAKTPPRVRLLASTDKHYDLDSFLLHASETDLQTNTNVYRGTHYEYQVAKTLRKFNFTLNRVGRANDLGIDLLGHWSLPHEAHELPVIIQCKATTPRPAMVRELEGAYAGAPTGWRGEDVMAFLIAAKPATKGVHEAMSRSRLPMAFLHVTPDGDVHQFVWNKIAEQQRLTGITATTIYKPGSPGLKHQADEKPGVKGAISLLYMGKQWDSISTQSWAR